MFPVDRLNVYTPGTSGFVLVQTGNYYTWVPGIIHGRVLGNYRRVIDLAGNHWFIECVEQWCLEQRWIKPKRINRHHLI